MSEQSEWIATSGRGRADLNAPAWNNWESCPILMWGRKATLRGGKAMDMQKEIEFLLLLDNKVTLLAEKVSVIGPLIEVIAMIKGRIQTLQHEAEFHPAGKV